MADVQEILKDKRVWAVAGVGGVAGLFMLVRSRGAGSSSTAAATPGYGVQTAGGAGTYDSTSSDVANQLGQYQTGLQTALGQFGTQQQAQLTAYQQSLTDSLKGLTSGQPSGGSITVVKPWKAASTYTADSVARRFGISIDTLQAANPGNNIKAGVAKGVQINVPLTTSNSSQFLKG